MPAAMMSLSSYSSRLCSQAWASRRDRSSSAPMLLFSRATSPTIAQLVAHALLVPVDVALEEVAHRGGERRQWGLELVRHRGEQARLEPIGLALGSGGRGRCLEAFPFEERADEVGEGYDQAGGVGRIRYGVRPGLDGECSGDAGGAMDHRVEPTVVGGDHSRRCARDSLFGILRQLVVQGPAGALAHGGVGSRAVQRLAAPSQVFPIQHEERRRARAQHLNDLAEAGFGHLLGGRLAGHGGAEPVERDRLLFSGDRPRLAFSQAPRLDADEQANDQKGDEREPVFRVAHSQRVIRRQEEEVPGEEGEHGGEYGRPCAGGAGDQEDGEEVEQRPLPLGERLQVPSREEEHGRQSDRQDGEKIAVP